MHQIPIELWEMTIDQADPPSLHRISLTCRAFLPRCRYHLFRNILIQTAQQMESFREFLDSRPWILPIIQKVTLSVLVPPNPSTPNIRVLDVVPLHFLSRCPNLRVWRMSVVESTGPKPFSVPFSGKAWLSLSRFALSCYQRYSGRIQILELSDIPFDDISDFTGLVEAVVGAHSLTCSRIRFRTAKEHRTSLHSTMATNFTKIPSLQIKNLRIGVSVDIRATEYLLASSAATLSNLSLAVGPSVPRKQVGGLNDFERLEESLTSHQLEPLRLSLVIPCQSLDFEAYSEAAERGDWTTLTYMRRATKILELIPRTRLGDVLVEFELVSIACLGGCLPWDGSSEACKALEKALATFPHHRILCHDPVFMRAGRVEFWSPTIERAFPKLKQRGLLTIPRTTAAVSYPSGHEHLVTCAVASRDSKIIVTASIDGTIIVWDAPSGTIVQEWLAHRHSVHDIALSPDGRRLVSGGGHQSDPVLVAWDIGHKLPKPTVIEGHTEPSVTCAWSPDGTFIASASADGTVRIWDAQTFQQRDLLKFLQAVPVPRQLQFSPDGQYLAWLSHSNSHSNDSPGSCSVWRPLSDQPSKTPSCHWSCEDICINALSFHRESRHIATAHGNLGGPLENNVVRMWDVETGAALAIFAGHKEPVPDVSFSPDGRTVLSASWDGCAKIWDIESGDEMAALVGDGGQVMEACFSPDGKYIATALSGGMLRLWSVDDRSCTAVFTEHKCNVLRIGFSPDGQFLVSGDNSGIVHIRRLSNFV